VVHSKEVDRRISWENLYNAYSVHKLFIKLRDTGTVDRRPGSGRPRTARTEETLSLFFRSSRSLPLTLFCWLSGEVTENTFSSVKKTKSVADCLNCWSRSLARFMRAAQFASVSSCARRFLKHFRCKSLHNLGHRRPMNTRLLWYLMNSPVGLRFVLLTQDYIINCLNVFFSVGTTWS